MIQSELDKTFYGVEFVRYESIRLPLEEYLKHKADQLRTRLKNQLHRAISLDLAYYKNGQGMVKQCSYYDRQYQH